MEDGRSKMGVGRWELEWEDGSWRIKMGKLRAGSGIQSLGKLRFMIKICLRSYSWGL